MQYEVLTAMQNSEKTVLQRGSVLSVLCTARRTRISGWTKGERSQKNCSAFCLRIVLVVGVSQSNLNAVISVDNGLTYLK